MRSIILFLFVAVVVAASIDATPVSGEIETFDEIFGKKECEEHACERSCSKKNKDGRCKKGRCKCSKRLSEDDEEVMEVSGDAIPVSGEIETFDEIFGKKECEEHACERSCSKKGKDGRCKRGRCKCSKRLSEDDEELMEVSGDAIPVSGETENFSDIFGKKRCEEQACERKCAQSNKDGRCKKGRCKCSKRLGEENEEEFESLIEAEEEAGWGRCIPTTCHITCTRVWGARLIASQCWAGVCKCIHRG